MRKPIYPPGGIVQAGLALVSEIDVVIRCDVQIVAALERFGIARRHQRLHSSCLYVEFHDAVHVVGDKHASFGVDLQPVGPAIVFDHKRPFAVRRDPEDPAKRDINDIEIALCVE